MNHLQQLKQSYSLTAYLMLALLAAAALWVGPAEQGTAQEGEVDVLHVQGNVYMLIGAGGNITVQAGDEGVLVVDTGLVGMSDQVIAAIRSISQEPIRYVINTHVHPDHTGGNLAVAEAGRRVIGGNFERDLDLSGNAPIIAHESVLFDMSTQDPAPPFDAWPTTTYIGGTKDLFFNGESIRIIHMANAQTNGDSIVHFRRSDVISAGDVFSTIQYPFIDVERGGTVAGMIDALNYILDLTIPAKAQEGGTMVIPGHGRPTDEYEVVEFRDMLTIIRDRVQALIDEGLSLREVQRRRPTVGFDARWGADSGFWTTRQFVEVIYREVTEDGSDKAT